jgi:succinate dehydrogenase / fumarate reductase cytochrome b subunit
MKHAARPVFLNLMQIELPVGALTSILHRITGVVLAAGVPAALYLLDRSLQSERGFVEVIGLLGSAAGKATAVLLIWALAHHALAGVRHLLTDFNVGSPLRTARRSAWVVNAGGVAVGLVAVGILL